jgi:hypothetical protein
MKVLEIIFILFIAPILILYLLINWIDRRLTHDMPDMQKKI